MEQEEFEQYYSHSMSEYAAEHVKAGNWSEDEALSQAEAQFEQLLPDGLASEGHVLFTLYHNGEKAVGTLWLTIEKSGGEKRCFIYDIKLDEDQRGKGLGRETMASLDEFARSEGVQQIGLHVFAHNLPAIALYEKMGYSMTDHQMKKRLD